MSKAYQNDWVEVEEVLLEVGARAPKVPEDTAKTPLRQWTRGYLLEEEAEIGQKVFIETVIGRKISGKLVEVNPRHVHDFGNTVKELVDVGCELRKEIKGL